MSQYDADNLVIHPGNSSDPDVIVEVRPEVAGWETFGSRRADSRSGNNGGLRPGNGR